MKNYNVSRGQIENADGTIIQLTQPLAQTEGRVYSEQEIEIIGAITNVIHNLNDLIHNIAFDKAPVLMQSAYDRAEECFEVLSQKFNQPTK